jgi:hypothetical protein
MLDTLTDKFNETFRNLTGRGRISEENIREAMREVRTSLLEADVNFKVVRDFTESVVQKAIGREVIKTLKPGEAMVQIVYEELVNLMGPGRHADLLRPAAADGHHDGRPAGLREDDDVRQARRRCWCRRATTRCCARPTCSGRRPSSSSTLGRS